MKQSLLIAAGASGAIAASLSNICNVDYITNSLPSGDSAIQGLVYGDVTAQPVYNSSVEAGNNYPAVTGRNFCNVTVTYNHAGKDDAVSIVLINPRQKLVLTFYSLPDQRMVLLPRAHSIQRPLPRHRWRWVRNQLRCVWSDGRSRVRSRCWMHRRRYGLGRRT
jgi:hypothetical protein